MIAPRIRMLAALAVAWALTTAVGAQEEAAAPSTSGAQVGGLSADMSLEALTKQDVMVPALSQVVNTVDRTESTVGRSPAAVFVITPEMIKRSGARNIPEALRMAPGVEVARIDSHTWAISIRGLNSKFANKTLVQIDRRVVYQATFGGVYWDTVDVVLEDIERIEVIRGPGVVAWGSNAMNGVINIITKNSKDTQGFLVSSGGGNQYRDFTTVRYGGRLNEDLTWRAYGKEFDNNSGWSRTGIQDQWDQQRGGFRMDYTPSKDELLTVQGDIYNGYEGERQFLSLASFPFFASVQRDAHVQGMNVLMRYSREIDDETGWQFQTYYDRYTRNRIPNYTAELRELYDIDLQYRCSPWEFHKIIMGANYRNSPDNITSELLVLPLLVPQSFDTEWASVFAEDTMTLWEDRWYFTLGLRLEHNTYGNFQAEPTARLLFLPSERASAWLAVSRAVRNPTRYDTGLGTFRRSIGSWLVTSGNPLFEPESVIAYEAGYRAAPTDTFSWDIAGYINDYRKLHGLGPFIVQPPPPPSPLPGAWQRSLVENNHSALTYGAEITATWQMRPDWKWFAAYSLFEVHSKGGDDFYNDVYNYGTPHNQLYLQSSMNLSDTIQFDVIGRYVDKIRFPNIPEYFEMDVRLGWLATKNLEFAIVGQNLMNNHHFEYADVILAQQNTAVRRGFYGMVTWTY